MQLLKLDMDGKQKQKSYKNGCVESSWKTKMETTWLTAPSRKLVHDLNWLKGISSRKCLLLA